MEEAETKIRQVVKDEYFAQTPKAAIDRKVAAIIQEAERRIKIPALTVAARKSLLQFYNTQYRELRRSFGWQLPVLAALFLLNGRTLTGRDIKPTRAQMAQARQTLAGQGYDASRLLGVPLQKFSQDYMRDNVKPALDRLAKQQAHDPGDVSGRNTLRNRAEMEVRYNDHMEQIAEFKEQGVNLVICSTHADCSDRCKPWQGRVYSLDGTSGTTDDGRRFQPLENATDIYYTTKAGKTYKNGLLGFKCRHFLVPYKSGYRFPKPNAAEERREYNITQTQRRMEAEVRKWRTQAIEYKDSGIKIHVRNIQTRKIEEIDAAMWARKKAIAANKAYIAYSKEHNRAYYPSRTKLL